MSNIINVLPILLIIIKLRYMWRPVTNFSQFLSNLHYERVYGWQF